MSRDRFFATVHAARAYTQGKRDYTRALDMFMSKIESPEQVTDTNDPEFKHARQAMAHGSRWMDYGYTRLLRDLHQETTLQRFHQFTSTLDEIAKHAAQKG